MSWIKADNEKEQRHFDYLERLRQSGDTNMYGAAPWLRSAFPRDFSPDLKPTEVLTKWMRLHDDPSRVLEEQPK